MEKMERIEVLKARFSKNLTTFSAEEIKNAVRNLYDMPDADIPFQVALEVLQEKLPENEFVAFCDSF